MTFVIVVLAVLLFATPASAQAPIPVPQMSLALGAPTATGQTVIISWSPSPSANVTGYGIDGGMNTGANYFTAEAPASPYNKIMPFPATASSMWSCVWPIVGGVNTRQSQQCSQVGLPTGAAPPTSQVIHVTANEPTTNADGTPITDLATMRLYWNITPGTLVGVENWPASKPTGGGVLDVTFTVPTNQGTLTGSMTALDQTGNESARSTPVNFTLGQTPPAVSFTLATATAGTGTGAISGGGSYPANQVVLIQATPSTGSTFTGWTGACTGTSPSCTLTMTGNLNVVGNFALKPPPSATLTITKAGTGQGTTTGQGTYPVGTVVTPTANAAAGSAFSGWSGACTGAGVCSITLSTATSLTATFTLLPPPASAAPSVLARCDKRIKATAPDATAGWIGQIKDGTANLGSSGGSPLQRDVLLEAGVHDITVTWTKTGVPARTSAVTTVTCP